MAEVFAAVASGAGLVSLAIQLLESSQKLKGLYNASKSAPKTVSDLCFELETLSLQLRQLERHRQHDRLDTQILDRCIAVCERRVVRVRDVVDAMARYMRRGVAFGSVYTAFKEPEMRKLLDELEQAKSSLSLAYISYCQSWNMRDSASQAIMLQRQNDILALQQLQLDAIQQNVSSGNALITPQVTHRRSEGSNTRPLHNSIQRRNRQKKRDSFRLRLPLPQWLTSRTWAFAASKAQSSWTLEIHPVYRRPSHNVPVFDCIRNGDIATFQRSLEAGNLSQWDVVQYDWHYESSLLGLAVLYDQYEFCDFLLDNFEHFRKEDQIIQAATIYDRFWVDPPAGEQILELFAGKHNMNVDITGPEDEIPSFLKAEFYRLRKIIMSYQSIPLTKLSLEDRFEIAMKVVELTPAEFLDTVGIGVGANLLALNDGFGATVLHWAAAQWSIAAGVKGYSSALTAHAEFVASLISAGSPMSAVDALGYSPLMYALLNDTQRSNVWHSHRIGYKDHLLLVNSWIRLLATTRILVPAYVETENSLLKSLGSDHAIRLIYQGRRAELDSIAIGDDTKMKINVKLVTEIDIRERKQTPGSFVHATLMPPKIWWYPWDPNIDGPYDDYHHWQIIDSKELKSSAPFTLTPDSIVEAQRDMTTILFDRSQDDSGPLAAIFQRNHQRISRERNSISTRRRSASMGTNPFYRYVSQVPQTVLLQEGYPLCLRVHKCPFDSQWGFKPLNMLESHHMWRNCMKGCPGRPDHATKISDSFRSLVP